MDNFIFSINVIMPMLIIFLLGYYLKYRGFITKEFIDIAYNIIFYIAIPCSLFTNISTSDIKDIFDIKYIVFIITVTIIVAVLLLTIVPLFIKNGSKASSLVQGMFRGNFIIFGIPLAINLYGGEKASQVMIILPIAMVVFSIISIIIFILLVNNGKENMSNKIKYILINIVKNPLVIASIISIIFAVNSFYLPLALNSVVISLGSMANPLSLLVLGAQFDFNQAKDGLKYSIPAAVIRLIIIPTFVLICAITLGFSGYQLGGIFIVFSAPTAVTTCIIASNMGGDVSIANQIVLVSTIMSAFTLVIGIFILKTLSLI